MELKVSIGIFLYRKKVTSVYFYTGRTYSINFVLNDFKLFCSNFFLYFQKERKKKKRTEHAYLMWNPQNNRLRKLESTMGQVMKLII